MTGFQVYNMPKEEEFHVTSTSPSERFGNQPVDAVDRELILATQSGLPLVSDPEQLGDQLGLSPEDVLARFRRMSEQGIIRRVAAVPETTCWATASTA